MKNYGWVCPVCGKVNAPWVDACNCHKKTTNVISGCPHSWVPVSIGNSTAVTLYRCEFCGQMRSELSNLISEMTESHN